MTSGCTMRRLLCERESPSLCTTDHHTTLNQGKPPMLAGDSLEEMAVWSRVLVAQGVAERAPSAISQPRPAFAELAVDGSGKPPSSSRLRGSSESVSLSSLTRCPASSVGRQLSTGTESPSSPSGGVADGGGKWADTVEIEMSGGKVPLPPTEPAAVVRVHRPMDTRTRIKALRHFLSPTRVEKRLKVMRRQEADATKGAGGSSTAA